MGLENVSVLLPKKIAKMCCWQLCHDFSAVLRFHSFCLFHLNFARSVSLYHAWVCLCKTRISFYPTQSQLCVMFNYPPQQCGVKERDPTAHCLRLFASFPAPPDELVEFRFLVICISLVLFCRWVWCLPLPVFAAVEREKHSHVVQPCS